MSVHESGEMYLEAILVLQNQKGNARPGRGQEDGHGGRLQNGTRHFRYIL